MCRQGETDWNKAGRFQGQYNSQLNDQGRRQAALAAEVSEAATSHLHRLHAELGSCRPLLLGSLAELAESCCCIPASRCCPPRQALAGRRNPTRTYEYPHPCASVCAMFAQNAREAPGQGHPLCRLIPETGETALFLGRRPVRSFPEGQAGWVQPGRRASTRRKRDGVATARQR